MARTIKLKDEKVTNQWQTLIEGAADKADFIFEKTQANLDRAGVGEISWEMVEASTGGLLGGGDVRDFLFVTSGSFKDHRNYVGARNYGSLLSVYRYGTVEPGFLKRTLSKKMYEGMNDAEQILSFSLDLFEQESLSSYTTVVHHALLDAVNELMDDLGQNFSKIKTESKGFLNVW